MGTDEENDGRRSSIPANAREKVHAAWLAVDNEKPDVSASTKRRFASLVGGYYRALQPHRDARAISTTDENGDKTTLWESSDIHWLPETLQQTKTVRDQTDGMATTVEETEIPVINTVPIEAVEHVARKLDDIARELGFTEEAAEETPKSEATPDDVKHILRARGQEQALENLPDSWTDDDG